MVWNILFVLYFVRLNEYDEVRVFEFFFIVYNGDF